MPFTFRRVLALPTSSANDMFLIAWRLTALTTEPCEIVNFSRLCCSTSLLTDYIGELRNIKGQIIKVVHLMSIGFGPVIVTNLFLLCMLQS